MNLAKTPHHLDVAVPFAIPALLLQPRLGTNFGLDLLGLPHDAVDFLLRREVLALLTQVRTEVRSDPSDERDNEQGRKFISIIARRTSPVLAKNPARTGTTLIASFTAGVSEPNPL